MFQESHFVLKARCLCCQVVMFRDKKVSQIARIMSFYLDYNMEKKESLYLNHLLSAGEALGKMMIWGGPVRAMW